MPLGLLTKAAAISVLKTPEATALTAAGEVVNPLRCAEIEKRFPGMVTAILKASEKPKKHERGSPRPFKTSKSSANEREQRGTRCPGCRSK